MKMKSLFLLQFFLLGLNAIAAESAWFARPMGFTKQKIKLNIIERNKELYVPLKDFCRAFGCKYTYQWDQNRVLISNPQLAKTGTAIFSSLTRVGIVDGLLIDTKAPILSEPRLGYVIPVDVLSSTAILMQLGEIESPIKPKVVDAEKVNQIPPPPIPKELKQEFNTLVIDPGHGGYDVGTKHGKLEEKDISLFYAISLRDSLKKAMPDLNVILTRETNDFISLNERSKIANQKNADLFLSLHVNHAPNEKIFGAETYILNPNATDDDAKKTAMLENDTFLKSLKEKETKSSKGTVLKILAEMEQTKYIQKSAYAAAFVQQELSALNATLGLKNRGVKQAMFYVLSQVAMPSVLVEMGFLSNPGDRSRLMDLKFRDEFTQKLIKALIRYREHLKSGT